MSTQSKTQTAPVIVFSLASVLSVSAATMPGAWRAVPLVAGLVLLFLGGVLLRGSSPVGWLPSNDESQRR